MLPNESNNTMANELENLRIALRVISFSPDSQAQSPEPEYVRDKPAVQMSATWGS
jgi:hypothetical protein